MTMRWYVVHAYSGYEKRVQTQLKERIELHDMQDKFGEVLVPTEEVVEVRDGKKRKSERKFYPGYVLVEMDMDDDSWHLVNQTPRVMGFIGGTADKPAPISKKEADAILQRVQDGADKPTHKTIYEPGEVVRVIDGPFADFNGVVETVDYEKSRLQVRRRWRLHFEGEAAVVVCSNNNWNRRTSFQTLSLGVECLTEFHDVQTHLTQCRTNRWTWVSFTSANLKLDIAFYFLSHVLFS